MLFNDMVRWLVEIELKIVEVKTIGEVQIFFTHNAATQTLTALIKSSHAFQFNSLDVPFCWGSFYMRIWCIATNSIRK